MTETLVHNINVSYDDSNFTTNHFVAYLKSDSMRNAVHPFFDAARKSFDYKISFKDKQGNEFYLKYLGDKKVNLALK